MLRCTAVLAMLVPLSMAMVLMPPTGVTNCNMGGASVYSVSLSPCTSTPCKLARGQTYYVNITFTPTADTTTVTKQFHGIVGGFSVPIPIGGGQPCNNGLRCPLTNGQQTSYATAIAVPTFSPPMHLEIKAELMNAQGRPFLCVEIPVAVV